MTEFHRNRSTFRSEVTVNPQENQPISSEATQSPASEAAPQADDLQLRSYDYELPGDRIAQNPVTPRDRSRLLVVKSPTHHEHRIFRELPDLLQPHDLLVLNNTRVLPARLFGCTTTGARVEVLLLEEQAPLRWLALVKPGKRMKIGTQIHFGADATHPENAVLEATVIDRDEATGGRILDFRLGQTHLGQMAEAPEETDARSLLSVIHQLGQVPLPP
jgi:S-adenosylmethionine:tRNA ribosyltransferase-isomerase